jgi:hypothetical protein
VAGAYFVGDGSQLTGVTASAANIFNTVDANGTSLVASSPNDTVTLTPGTNVTITGNATSKTATVGLATAPTFSGNVTGGNLLTGGVVSATGNVTGAYFLGNVANATGAELSHIHPAIVSGTSTVAIPLISGNAVVTVGGVSNVVVFASTGAYVSGLVSAVGNVSGGNVTSPGVISATGNIVAANVSTTGIVTATTVSATGNIQGNYFIGNGSLLTGIAAGGYGNSNVVTLLAGFGSNTISTTGNVTAGNFIGGGAGTPTVSSATNLDLSAAAAVRVIGGGTFRLPNLTSAQIANLTAANGDMVYNTTTTKIQAYANGAWGNITLT